MTTAAMNNDPIILIPLGGLGQRFADVGHSRPKPLINALGDPILYWLLHSLNITNRSGNSNHVRCVLIPYHPDLGRFRFEDRLRKDFPDIPFSFVQLSGNTMGAADTMRIALQSLGSDFPDSPIISLDGDNFYTIDLISEWMGRDSLNCLVTFNDYGDSPIYSYVRLGGNDDDRNKRPKVVEIKEKVKISDQACTGAYAFFSWKQLLKCCLKTLSNPANKQKNEFYISSVIALMINTGEASFETLVVPKNSYVCLGTPLQLRAFCNDFPQRNAVTGELLVKPRRFCFDLDNTLVTFPRVAGDYTTVEPISYMIDYLKYLKRFHHTIIIYTARRMGTHKGNAAAATADIGLITFQTLEKFGIPYDEICFGKPVADHYVDDLAVSAYDDVEKELGFYRTQVKPRAFNDISQPPPLQLMRKSDKSGRGLEGEIYFYNHFPLSVKDCFPIMLHHDKNCRWYDMERIDGSVVSNLFLSEELTPTSLAAIMGSLHRIHTANDFRDNSHEQALDIHANYVAKLRSRYETYDYSRLPGSADVFAELQLQLESYEQSGRSREAVIHGDPVMSNIFINSFGKVKLIDMRGQLGDTLTCRGDETYDWGKLFQSLLGYDEILQNRTIPESYRRSLVNCFWSTLHELSPDVRPEDVKLVTRSLLFSLIPLHTAPDESEKQMAYYALIQKCM